MTQCKDHKYKWFETVRRCNAFNDFEREYVLIDRFYCPVCLEIKDITKREIIPRNRKMPGWY